MFRDRWALITGAARGIGRATSELLASQGARLVLCDIDGSAVDELGSALRAQGATALTYGVDVGDRAAMQAFADWTRHQVGDIDFLVNNAGILEVGELVDTSWEAWDRVIQVNLWGVVHSCRLFVPLLRRHGRSHIVNVASAAGEVGFSSLLAYSTSKFAVVGFSQALRAQLAEEGIGVSVVCPGLVNTQIGEQERFDDHMRARLRTLLQRHGLPPRRVAEAIGDAIRRNRGTVLVGAQATALHWARRMFPAQASAWLHRASRSSRFSEGEPR